MDNSNINNIGFFELVSNIKSKKERKDKKICLKEYIVSKFNKDNKMFFLNNKKSLFEDGKKNKRIFYKYEIKKFWKEYISEDVIDIIKYLYYSLINEKPVNIHFKALKVLRDYFNIFISGNSKNDFRLFKMYYYYSYCYKYLDYVESRFILTPLSKSEKYISKAVSYKTSSLLHEHRIYKIKDLFNISIDTVDLINLKKYIKDLERFQIDSSLFKSIISFEEEQLLIEYIGIRNYKEISKRMCLSDTTVRGMIYTIINKLVVFFESSEGIRALNILFSRNDNYLSKKDIEEIFLSTSEIFLFLVENDYIYNLYYNSKYEIVTNNIRIDDKIFFKKYKNEVLIEELKYYFMDNNIFIDERIIQKRIKLEK